VREETVTLYRPVGAEEPRPIEAADMCRFPKRLPDQPTFYPVSNEAYAAVIARTWNTKTGSKAGFRHPLSAGVKNADFKSATYAAMGRVTPADYFDGEDK